MPTYGSMKSLTNPRPTEPDNFIEQNASFLNLAILTKVVI